MQCLRVEEREANVEFPVRLMAVRVFFSHLQLRVLSDRSDNDKNSNIANIIILLLIYMRLHRKKNNFFIYLNSFMII